MQLQYLAATTHIRESMVNFVLRIVEFLKRVVFLKFLKRDVSAENVERVFMEQYSNVAIDANIPTAPSSVPTIVTAQTSQ